MGQLHPCLSVSGRSIGGAKSGKATQHKAAPAWFKANHGPNVAGVHVGQFYLSAATAVFSGHSCSWDGCAADPGQFYLKAIGPDCEAHEAVSTLLCNHV